MQEKTERWIKYFSSGEIRLRATDTLLKKSDTPVEVLFEIIDSDPRIPQCRKAKKNLLKKPNYEIFAPTSRRLKSPYSHVRIIACEALRELGCHEATSHLVALLEDHDAWVQRAAAENLGYLGDHSALISLKEKLHGIENDDINFRAALKFAIRRLESI